MPDPYIHIDFRTRIRRLRHAIHYSVSKFARIMYVSSDTIKTWEGSCYGQKLGRVTVTHIRRLRLLEKAFHTTLEEYISGKRRGWGRTRKLYEKYTGYTFTRRLDFSRSSFLLPERKEDIEALGGMEVFGDPQRVEREWRKQHGERVESEGEDNP